MNYIKSLQEENLALKRQIKGLEDGISDLRAYLALPKFNCGDRLDGYVNIGDILLRLREAENFAIHQRENPSEKYSPFQDPPEYHESFA